LAVAFSASPLTICHAHSDPTPSECRHLSPRHRGSFSLDINMALKRQGRLFSTTRDQGLSDHLRTGSPCDLRNLTTDIRSMAHQACLEQRRCQSMSVSAENHLNSFGPLTISLDRNLPKVEGGYMSHEPSEASPGLLRRQSLTSNNSKRSRDAMLKSQEQPIFSMPRHCHIHCM
jgi:hypothetical protein